MKKFSKRLMLLTAFLMSFVIAGCSTLNSKIVSADEFKSVVEKRGMDISELSVSDIDIALAQNHLNIAYKATGLDYEFVFAEFDDKISGEDYYNTIIDNIQSNHSFGITTNATVDDNNEWSAEADGLYFDIIRKSGTIVSVTAKSESKDTIKEIIKDLGY